MKKRYALSLDQKLVEDFKKALKELGFPPNTFSAIVNDMLEGTYPVYRKMADQKAEGEQLTMDEVIQGMADSMKKMLSE